MKDELIKSNPAVVLARKIISALGGPTATAELCDIRQPAVSAWQTKNSKGIPKARLLFFKSIRPDLFVDANNDEVIPNISHEDRST